MRARTFLSLALTWTLSGCAKPTEVELRLYPCGDPERVDLDVQGYDADGSKLPALSASFVVADSGVFGDDYATVGLRKPDGMVTADFTLTWHGRGEAEAVVTLRGLAVPAAGEVLELGATDCMPVGATSTGDTSTGAGTGTSTGTTGGTVAMTSTDTSTDAGTTGTSTSTGETGETTTTGTTGATTGSTGDTTTDDTTTGGDTLEGKGCDPDNADFACDNGGPGQVGDLLKCIGQVPNATWQKVPPSMCILAISCSDIGIMQPVGVGCSGQGLQFACLCQESPPVDCDGSEEPCSDPEMNKLTLCVDVGDGPKRTQTHCGLCNADDPDKPYCQE